LEDVRRTDATDATVASDASDASDLVVVPEPAGVVDYAGLDEWDEPAVASGS
jgi:hypothetical protein